MPTGLRAGEIVGGFRVASVIGEGAMGTVYLAEPPDNGRVALKVLAPELARDDRFRRRFLRETELAATLDHANIVRTIAAGEENGALYLAMEYVEGPDLRELLRRDGRLEPDRALHLLSQVAAALDAAHEAGLVHRDVKPGNILVAAAPDGERTYVCDFGLARHVSSPSSLTGDRGFVGTIDYVPPEQIEGGAIDGRADVYSLGCVLFECLAGTRPFDRDSELAVVFAHLNEPPPRLTELRPELPEAFDGVFNTALAKSPDERYATCGELVEAARVALQGKSFARRKSRQRFVIAAAAVLAAAGATVGAVLASGGGSPGPPQITETSIAGARLGLRRAAYERIFGERGELFYQQQGGGTGYATLIFADKKVRVFFPNVITGRASIITTWDNSYKTAAGVGPCSTIDDVKAAYGSALEPDRSGTIGKSHFVYDVGKNLVFATPGTSGHPSKTVTAVGLFSGGVPGADRDGGPRNLAGFVAGNETPSCHP